MNHRYQTLVAVKPQQAVAIAGDTVVVQPQRTPLFSWTNAIVAFIGYTLGFWIGSGESPLATWKRWRR